jgi:hypothetical protein
MNKPPAQCARELRGLIRLALELAGAYLLAIARRWNAVALTWNSCATSSREAMAGQGIFTALPSTRLDLYATPRDCEDEILAEEPRMREIVDLFGMRKPFGAPGLIGVDVRRCSVWLISLN